MDAEKKTIFLVQFQIRGLFSAKLAPPPLQLCVILFLFPPVLLHAAQQLLHLIPEAVAGSEQSDLHITSLVLISVHYEA